jgi:hypothetical protein
MDEEGMDNDSQDFFSERKISRSIKWYDNFMTILSDNFSDNFT